MTEPAERQPAPTLRLPDPEVADPTSAMVPRFNLLFRWFARRYFRHFDLDDATVARLRELRVVDPDAVDAALVWSHHRVMPELFSLMTTSCESLCDELSVDCAALDPASVDADLDVIRAQAATQYVSGLGFGS